MASLNLIGTVQVTSGNIKILGVDGVVRDAVYDEYIHEGEQIISDDSSAHLQIKYFEPSEVKAYVGEFRIMADGSEVEDMEDVSIIDDDVDIFETAAGEEGVESNSQNIEDNPQAIDYEQSFNRNTNDTIYFDEKHLVEENQFGAGKTDEVLVEDASPEDTTPEDTPPEEPPAENNAPEALADVITKVADSVVVEVDGVEMSVGATGEGFEVYENNGWYGINDLNEQHDSQSHVDNYGEFAETIIFSMINGEARDAVIEFKTAGDKIPGNDEISVKLYNDSTFVAEVDTTNIIKENGVLTLTVDPDGDLTFDEIRISALEGDTQTQFKVSSVDATLYDEVQTVLPFVIDDNMLLANDTDVDDDSLSIVLVDGKLMASDGITQVGDVSINGDGDIDVTPYEVLDYSDGDTLTFTYVVTDGTDTSDEAIATINIQHGDDISANEVIYNQGTGEFIIGTDSGSEVGYDQNSGEFISGSDYEAMSDNTLNVGETIDLSDVSNINTIQLEGSATVTGSSDLGHVNPDDVMSATDSDNTLVIQSSDGVASNQVDVHESFGDAVNVEIDGIDYAQYTDGTATLLVEIDEPIDVV